MGHYLTPQDKTRVVKPFDKDVIQWPQQRLPVQTVVRPDYKTDFQREQASEYTKQRLAQEKYGNNLASSQHLWNFPGRANHVVANSEEAYAAFSANKVPAFAIRLGVGRYAPEGSMIKDYIHPIFRGINMGGKAGYWYRDKEEDIRKYAPWR